ncbi:DUF2892 domain-containing protein [Candidatus Azambacteria bacterium]|nr:DUF2892 domain-containing protein [Candidatus Azambacteria bacterium]
MMCNVGKTERMIRFILGLVFLWVGYTYNPWWYALAAILILTSLAGFCPISKTLGLNTCGKVDDGAGDDDSKDDGPSIESWKKPGEK